MRQRRHQRAINGLAWVAMVAILAVFLFPVFFMVVTSLKGKGEYLTSPPIFWPSKFHFENYVEALTAWRGAKGLLDSLIVATFSTLLSLIVGVPAAYSIARFRTGGDNLSFWILSIRMTPPVAAILPLFLLWKKLGLVDTHFALIVTHLVFNLPFVVWLMKGFFEDLSPEVEEAALVDGVSRLRAFRDISLPLVKPGMVATALFCFIFSWNEFIFALILGRRVVTTLPFLVPAMMSGHMILWGHIGAIATVAVLPVVAIAVVLQRYLVRGLSFGAMKT